MGWFAVIYNLDGRPASRRLREQMLSAIGHRGPDGCGQWIGGAVAMGCQTFHTAPEAVCEDGVSDAPVAPAFAEPLRHDSAVASLAAGVERRLFASGGTRARLYSEWVVPISTFTSARGRVRCLASCALTPNTGDPDFPPLPPSLYPVHYAMRPFRLAWQQGRKLFVNLAHRLKRLRGSRR
jgi:hypothetical protein